MTNSEQSVTLSKSVLLNLVDWVRKYHARHSYIGTNEVGKSSQRESSSPNNSISNIIIEEIARIDNKYGEGK
ncbi:hypothetical protein [Candidatus Tisiphia endosymbiont of Empis tessellata]|uniref:hypothetical protein n=1 Tax=Candidatus Tisiphia endosymbiont of Empis tessellata TaxID=3066259 RepID=UPI00313CC641